MKLLISTLLGLIPVLGFSQNQITITPRFAFTESYQLATNFTSSKYRYIGELQSSRNFWHYGVEISYKDFLLCYTESNTEYDFSFSESSELYQSNFYNYLHSRRNRRLGFGKIINISSAIKLKSMIGASFYYWINAAVYINYDLLELLEFNNPDQEGISPYISNEVNIYITDKLYLSAGFELEYVNMNIDYINGHLNINPYIGFGFNLNMIKW